MNNEVTVAVAAKVLNLTERRVRAKLRQGHFPNAEYSEIANRWLIPRGDLENEIKRIERLERAAKI